MCHSLQARGYRGGARFPYDQYSDRFTSRAKACSALDLDLYINIFIFCILCHHSVLLFSLSSAHMLFL